MALFGPFLSLLFLFPCELVAYASCLQEHFYSLDKTEMHLPPRLTIQIWDNDLFNPDDFIGNCPPLVRIVIGVVVLIHLALPPSVPPGTLDINLTRMPDARKTAEECDIDQLLDDGDPESTNGKSQPRKKNVLNLFEKKRVKGWWPAAGEDEEGKRILAVSHGQKMVDRCSWKIILSSLYHTQGKMELEFEVVTEEEEQLRPAGQAREEPNMNPHLEEPK